MKEPTEAPEQRVSEAKCKCRSKCASHPNCTHPDCEDDRTGCPIHNASQPASAAPDINATELGARVIERLRNLNIFGGYCNHARAADEAGNVIREALAASATSAEESPAAEAKDSAHAGNTEPAGLRSREESGDNRPRIHNKKMLNAIEAVIIEHSGNGEFAEYVRRYISAERSCDLCDRIATKRSDTFLYCDNHAPRNAQPVSPPSQRPTGSEQMEASPETRTPQGRSPEETGRA